MRTTESIATWQLLKHHDTTSVFIHPLYESDPAVTLAAPNGAQHSYRLPSAEQRAHVDAELERGVGHSALTLAYEGQLPEYCR
jgi:hypothetical protein